MSSLLKTAVITGASSGIGEAAARQLAAASFQVVIGARRLERLQTLAEEIGAQAYALDVTSQSSVDEFADQVAHADILINNAGGALGRDSVGGANTQQWLTMYETNVLGLMRVTRAFLPKLIASGEGHIVTIGSVAAFETYVGGGGYTAAKHGARAVTSTLRQELIGQPVRVTEIDPGLVNTEFSLVRFGGDAAQADKVYAGMTPLVASDVAEAIVWAVTRPAHVNIDQIVIKPLDQVNASLVHRRE